MINLLVEVFFFSSFVLMFVSLVQCLLFNFCRMSNSDDIIIIIIINA